MASSSFDFASSSNVSLYYLPLLLLRYSSDSSLQMVISTFITSLGPPSTMLSRQVLPLCPLIVDFNFTLFASLYHSIILFVHVLNDKQSCFYYPRTNHQSMKGTLHLTHRTAHYRPLRIRAPKPSMTNADRSEASHPMNAKERRPSCRI